MRKGLIYLFAIASISINSCNNSVKTGEVSEVNEPSQQELAEGFQLIENNCFTCHSPNASIKNRVAPSMIAVKKHYMNEGISQEQFAKDIMAFLNDPNEDISKMPGAVRRFNLMPKMSFNEDQIAKIVTYIYHSEIEKPDWFEKHYKEEREKHLVKSSFLSPIEYGQSIAMKTKGTLGKNLLHAINSEGAENAVSFCSTQAITLTDSIAVSLNAKVKRVSDKNRNPNNEASTEELNYIISTKKRLVNNKKPIPKLTTDGRKQVGYYPIVAGKMCMQCHGEPKTEILSNTLVKIKGLYPNDKAVGYKTDELRGIWVVEWVKRNEPSN